MANKNVKVVKSNKKKFNWNKVIYYLKSLVNNGVCKEIGAKHWAWSILVFFISMFMSITPLLTKELTRNGSASINTTYNDVLVESLYDYSLGDTLDLKVIDSKLSLVNDDTSSSVNLFTYDRNNKRLDIYYINTLNGNPSFNETKTAIEKNNTNLQSVVYFSSEYFQVSLYSGTSLVASAAGNYTKVSDISSFKEYLLNNVDLSKDIVTIKSNIASNFFKFADDAYLALRNQQTFISVGLVLGVNAGLTIFLVPILFLLSRGKRNPNRTLKFYEIMGITFMTTLTPGLITLILGFILGSNYQYMLMLYIMTFGFRAMWLSMKYLRPPVEQ